MTTTAAPAVSMPRVGAATGQPAGGGLSHRQIMTILVGLLLGMFLAALDLNIVGIAMPRIANDLHGLNIQAWVTTAYLITSTVTTPLYGKLSDLYGRKPFYLTAISLFLIGSAASTFATSMYELAAFRAFQGLGAGGLMSLAFTILGDIVSPRDRAKYMGYFMAVFGTSSVLGPVIGGALSGADSILGIAGWRWVFLVNLPIGLIALFVVAKVLNVPHSRKAHHRIDWGGAFTLIVGLVPLLIVAQQGQTWGWGDVKSIICYVVTGVGIAAFIGVELLMKDHALIPMRLFRSSTYSLIIVASVLIGVGMFGGMTLIPQYLQIVRGLSPTASGLQMLPLMVGVMSGSMVSGQITSRTGRYKIFPIIGTVFVTGGALLFTRLAADTAMWQVMSYMFVYGLGVGLCMQTLNLAAQNAAPAKDMGVSTASATFFRQTGGTLGVAVFLSIVFSTVATRITNAFHAAAGTAAFQSALHDPKVLANPANAAVLHGSAVSGATQDASFLSRIDPRLAWPFKVGFSQSIDTVFWVAAGVAVLAFLVVWFIKEIPLRTQSGMQAAMVEGAEGALPVDGPVDAPVDAALDAELAGMTSEAELVSAGRHALAAPNGSTNGVGNGISNGSANGHAVLTGVLAEPGTPIAGRVRRIGGEAVAGAVLTLINHGGQQVARGTSGPDGGYRLTAPLDGVYVLIASSPGHQPQATTLRVAGSGINTDVLLAGTARALGVIRAGGRGEAGSNTVPIAVSTAVPNATVTLTDARGEVVGSRPSDPDGRYLFDELLGGPYTLVVAANGYRPFATTVTVPDSGDAVTDVELTGAARLTGVARVGESGRPVADARVTLVDAAGNVVAMTATDDAGAYTFADVPEGDYTVIASGYPPVTSHPRLSAGQEHLHDVVLGHSEI